ncbi:glycoside hydrolase family 43 protein [Humisphaera borealis]|uniref:glycoside hydrolase family 43 protein n=1 Tax=Humisphaera borealis TaxID=2807512 RepID=UPI0019D18CBB|nr:glycoside hydrolase family 43 protein [Humisphaera borealis]
MTMKYCNPVYPHDFADPFVLKTGDLYYAFGTSAPGSDGRPFPVLRSTDLVHWIPLGGALTPLSNPIAHSYWAPEVIERQGSFYLFYSASTSTSDEHHRLRVARSDNPAGPYKDCGRSLLPNIGFSIDASPFHDVATDKYFLYFANDFETSEPHGTGISVVELADDFLSVVGEPQTVVRALADWQIYERNRNYKGRVWERWHCVEGPSVVFRDGQYYCFYSGGAWHGTEYGVGYAVASHPLGPWRDDFAAHGPVVLKGIPEGSWGPGITALP